MKSTPLIQCCSWVAADLGVLSCSSVSLAKEAQRAIQMSDCTGQEHQFDASCEGISSHLGISGDIQSAIQKIGGMLIACFS